jgi:hypothetical protein
MKVEGNYRIAAARGIVFEKLLDPQALARALPGCQKLEPNPDGSFRAEMKIGIAAVRGNYRGRVEILDAKPPESFRLKVDGQGAGGFVKGEGTLVLEESGEGETVINYSGDAQVGGTIAGVGQRLVQAAARQMINQFFEAFAMQLPRKPTPPHKFLPI